PLPGTTRFVIASAGRFRLKCSCLLPAAQSLMPARTATPDLTLPLAQPITLTGGPRSHLVTLMDAAILIRDLEPFRQPRPVWDRGAEMILTAATTGARADIAERRVSCSSVSSARTGGNLPAPKS